MSKGKLILIALCALPVIKIASLAAPWSLPSSDIFRDPWGATIAWLQKDVDDKGRWIAEREAQAAVPIRKTTGENPPVAEHGTQAPIASDLPPSENIAVLGAMMSVYQTVCKGAVPVPVWDFLLDGMSKYGVTQASKDAAQRKIRSLLDDRKQYGDAQFCMALTKSVDVMMPGLRILADQR